MGKLKPHQFIFKCHISQCRYCKNKIYAIIVSRSVLKCAAYLLINYPEDFLEGRETLSNYVEKADQRYVLPEWRPDAVKAKDDLAYRP